MGVLINKKTGLEFQTSDPDGVMKKYPKTFKKKPATKVSNAVAKKESEISNKNVVDIEKDIKAVDSIDELKSKLNIEKKGKNRTTAVDAIESRIKEVETDKESTKN